MIDFNIIICLNLKAMITDADIKKMKTVFVTKKDLKNYPTRIEMGAGFEELVKFIGETKSDIMKELNDFREEFYEFRQEMRDINRNLQSILNNHESRITRLEFNKQ